MAQLETAKSVKADFTYELDATVKSWSRWDDYGNEVTPYQETTSAKATITGSGTIMYTTDGSDPRYSKEAKLYSAAVAVAAGAEVRAYAKEEGKFWSAVAAFDVVG